MTTARSCPRCGDAREPYRFAARPLVRRCRGCRADTSVLRGTVAEDSRVPPATWLAAAELVAARPAITAREIQRELGLTRYATAWRVRRRILEGATVPEDW